MLSIEGLTKEFGSLVAIEDLDLELEPGEIHGLIGPNGAGKTTTINLITGDLAPTRGTIMYDGEDIAGRSPTDIANMGIGRSFQVVQYFPEMTVRKHLRLASRDPTRTVLSAFTPRTDYTEKIEEIAETAHLDGRLDTVAKNLSHGEQRFLDIAMVLAMDPEVILFDEPAAGLNHSETEEVRQIFEDMRGDYTMLVVEHDIDLVRALSDRISVLHNGSILTTGPPSEVVENETVKEVYLGE
ncbi:ABC-type branched-subunit amino acid transport system ATPase component [Halarchaeum rubridurum]|uniref:ABC transporter ATP-binding protein n=1 Tax=Halarchaeum rubridurum TaxID=489911 RepID=A0A830FMH1_9EURY|nr:ABC transporter ATP-binding protein [Halarchaeum rubridurum]MBP1954507.1 ABC-type branched-subunit amino acid transport system ATPase component [Halarchaeum rubridurum]GGM61645.1 ABC transporter ATP-binding protein [Halarchaeum rubridurum]